MADATLLEPAARGLTIVLFGMPAAGKSYLLGALAQAAQTQSALLGGRLDNVPEGLEELHKRVYENKPRETLEEVVFYSLTFQAESGAAVDATLIDCDGRVAQAYIQGAKALDEAPGALAQALQNADVVILAVDASAMPTQLESEFAQFGEFLRWFQEHRSQHNEVAGLPVYLVLTKCDLLAKADDSASRWMQRIEEGKRKTGEKFRELLQGEKKAAALFGEIELHLWATAVKRPPLSDRAGKPSEPYGVAELFRQVFASGQEYHRHRRASGRRLVMAVTGVALLVGLLVVLAAVFLLTRPDPNLVALEQALRRALPANSAERLREPLNDRLGQLREIQAQALFNKLPAQEQEEVKQAIQEIATYLDRDKDFKAQLQEPKRILTYDDLLKNQKDLDKFSLPAEYASSWSETKLAQRRQQWREELSRLLRAVEDVKGQFTKLADEGEQLETTRQKILSGELTPQEIKQWNVQVKEYVNRSFPNLIDRVPKHDPLTYNDVLRIDAVTQALNRWKEVKRKVEAKLTQ